MKWLFVALALLSGLVFFWKKEPEPADWMDRAVKREFAHFEKRGIDKKWLDETWDQVKERKEFKRFQIIRSKVYGPPCRMRNLLEAMVETYPVPDVDFIYYNEDRVKKSFFKRRGMRDSAPIFVSAKHKSLDRAILFSDWIYDYKDQKAGWNFLIQAVNGNQSPWEEKVEKLFWRGTPWDGKHFDMYTFENWKELPRGKLVYMSQKNPDLIDAGFSQYPFTCVGMDPERCVKDLGPISFVSWADTMKFKYQMAMDGVTCSFPATHWKLLSGCLTFKQDSDDIMYFYDEMAPWKHYVPVRGDLADLEEKIRWAKEHDKEAKEIAENARQFALDHLMPEHILLYSYKALVKYASLQKFQPALEN